MQGNYLLGAALACTSGAPVSAGVVHAASMHRVQQLDALGGGCSKCMRSQHHPLTCMFFIHGTLLSTVQCLAVYHGISGVDVAVGFPVRNHFICFCTLSICPCHCLAGRVHYAAESAVCQHFRSG